jgi:hypothetical protein
LYTISGCLEEDFLNHKEEASEQMQLEAAYSISILADRYGSFLNQITKKYPGAWKSISEFQKKQYKENLNHENEVCKENLTTQNGTCYAP